MSFPPDQSPNQAATEAGDRSSSPGWPPSTPANDPSIPDSSENPAPDSSPKPSTVNGAVEHSLGLDDIPSSEPPPFAKYEPIAPQPSVPRKPNFGDLLIFLIVIYASLRVSVLLVVAALHYHLFGVSSLKQAEDEIHYKLGSQAGWYLITLLFCIVVFPLVWTIEERIGKHYDSGWKAGAGFFAGIHWNARGAARHVFRLFGAAGACFVVAIADQILIPGPADTPIDKTFHIPGAIWLLFAFGVTLAPIFEEIAFRGFLLPTLCTAYDWTLEQVTGSKPPLPDFDGGARWSPAAMVVASVVTSIPFALMHGEQTGYSIGPFLLLVLISLVLCWIRLATRSLAASVLVHSSYNLLLFGLMFLGTGGFQHLDRM